MPKTITLDDMGWVIPFKRLEQELAKEKEITLVVANEGLAEDIRSWARFRGFQITRDWWVQKTYRITVKMPEKLPEPEKPAAKPAEKPAAKPAKAKPAEKPAAKPAVEKAPSKIEGFKISPTITVVSQKMQDPVFKAQLLLGGKSTFRVKKSLPAKLSDILKEAASRAGGECVNLDVSVPFENINRISVMLCNDTIYGIVLRYSDGKASAGAPAYEAVKKELSQMKGEAVLIGTIVNRSFIRSLEA